MSRYYGVKLKDNTEFVVVKHSLRGFEGELNGIKYREGYAVVVKNSKSYRDLKKFKPTPVQSEFDILKLEDLKCVINTRQIQYIWGRAVYDFYLSRKFKADNPTDIRVQLEKRESCKAKTKSGTDCKNKTLEGSEYCKSHIQFDPRIKEDCEKMGIMPVKEKKKVINKLIEERIKPQESK